MQITGRKKQSKNFMWVFHAFCSVLYYLNSLLPYKHKYEKEKRGLNYDTMAWCFGCYPVSELSCFNKEAGDWEKNSCSHRSSGLKSYLDFQIKAKGDCWQ